MKGEDWIPVGVALFFIAAVIAVGLAFSWILSIDRQDIVDFGREVRSIVEDIQE